MFGTEFWGCNGLFASGLKFEEKLHVAVELAVGGIDAALQKLSLEKLQVIEMVGVSYFNVGVIHDTAP